jgi:hypothetical protein
MCVIDDAGVKDKTGEAQACKVVGCSADGTVVAS